MTEIQLTLRFKNFIGSIIPGQDIILYCVCHDSAIIYLLSISVASCEEIDQTGVEVRLCREL